MRWKNSMEQYKYIAFISYSSADAKWGRKLQRKLEGYRMPATLCAERGWKRNPIKPVFRDKTDIQPNPLEDELKARLRASKNLIIICSPHSAASEWVAWEIRYFCEIGRQNKISLFIVDGIPHSGNPKTECFNPVLEELGLPEFLAANVNEKVSRFPWVNRERAYVQLITKLLDVEFDLIWRRHVRLMLGHILIQLCGAVLIAGSLYAMYLYNRPVEVSVSVECSPVVVSLPSFGHAVVQLSLDNEYKTDTLKSSGGKVNFPNIPRKFIGKSIRMRINATAFVPMDTIVNLSKNIILPFRRDEDFYGKVNFVLFDAGGKRLCRYPVIVAGEHCFSDGSGRVKLSVPIMHQRASYEICSEDNRHIGTVYMPCGNMDAIILNNNEN